GTSSRCAGTWPTGSKRTPNALRCCSGAPADRPMRDITGDSPSRLVARVSRFGDPTAMVLAREPLRPPRGNDVIVRVTHASLGATDLLARRGGYVLQPAPGFVTGYDFVGELMT